MPVITSTRVHRSGIRVYEDALLLSEASASGFHSIQSSTRTDEKSMRRQYRLLNVCEAAARKTSTESSVGMESQSNAIVTFL